LSALSIAVIPACMLAQNVGINATGAAPAASALLDLTSTTGGFLVPRMTLAQRNAIAAPATGLLIYQTDAVVAAPPVPAVPANTFWYYNGTVWVPLFAGTSGWGLNGNNGTVAGTNFLGTTDNVDFTLRTNNLERMRVLGANGRVGINISPTLAQLEVSSGTFDAVSGHSSNVGGFLGRETNITLGVPPQSLLGAGVYASNPNAGYTSTYAQSLGPNANVAAAIAYSDVWMAQYNYTQNASAVYNPSATYSQLNVTNAALGGDQKAFHAYSGRGTTAGNPGFTIGAIAYGDAQNQDAIGVDGEVFTNQITRAGGYFESYNYAGVSQAYAWVGTTTGGVARKITGTAAVSEIIPTPDHGRVMLTCPESPEYWYQDYGTVQLVNGQAHVDLDPILADIIMVTPEYPVRVFCTPVDMVDFNGVAVINRSGSGFDLVELNGGTHSGTLDYQLIAKPKTGFGEGRFPQGPGPKWLKPAMDPPQARAANQVDPTRVFHWPSDVEVYGLDPARSTAIGQIVPAGPHRGRYKAAEGVYLEHMPVSSSGPGGQ